MTKEHGEWIPICNKRGTEIAVRCSSCCNSPWRGHRSDFCPNCGADMRALVHTVKEPTDDCVAIEFSADVDEPNKWQSKDGEWHTGIIPTKTESEDNE